MTLPGLEGRFFLLRRVVLCVRTLTVPCSPCIGIIAIFLSLGSVMSNTLWVLGVTVQEPGEVCIRKRSPIPIKRVAIPQWNIPCGSH